MDGGKRYQIACVEENILVRFPANEIWELKKLITPEFGLRQEHWEGGLSSIKLVWSGTGWNFYPASIKAESLLLVSSFVREFFARFSGFPSSTTSNISMSLN